MKKIILSTIACAAVALVGAQTVRNLQLVEKSGNVISFPADQVDGVIFDDAPYYVDLTTLLNTAYEEKGNSASYLIELGTGEPGPDGFPLYIGEMQVALLMQAPKSANLNQPELPEGYYGIGNGSTDFTFNVNRSAVWVRAAEGDDGVAPQMILAGSVDVRKDANGEYDIRCEFLTMGGAVNMRYTGPVTFRPGLSDYESFTEPINVNFTDATGRFYGNWFYPFAADLAVTFTQGNFVDGKMTDGYTLYIDFNEPKPADCMAPNQVIADGTYRADIRDAVEYTYLPYTFNRGRWVDFMGQVMLTHSRIEYLAPTGHRKLGIINGGTFTVSENGSKIEFDLVTSDGIPVKGTYNKKPNIANYCDNDEREPKRPYSTLKENVTLDWAQGTVAVYYNEGHSILEDANTFMLMITHPQMDKGDYISVDLLLDKDQITDGTYTVERKLESGCIYPGTVNYGGAPLFAWYGDLDTTDADGYQEVLGPIESGTIVISTVGNQRKMVFNLTDDQGYKITGEYVGPMIDITDDVNQTSAIKKKASRQIKLRKIK